MKLSILARFLNGRSFRANTIVQRTAVQATDGYATLKQHVLVVANETLTVYYRRARARIPPHLPGRLRFAVPSPPLTTTYPNAQRRDGSVNSDITRGSVARVN